MRQEQTIGKAFHKSCYSRSDLDLWLKKTIKLKKKSSLSFKDTFSNLLSLNDFLDWLLPNDGVSATTQAPHAAIVEL
jgi:hypothetical protein